MRKSEAKRSYFSVTWNKLGVWLVVIGLFLLIAITCDNFLSRANLINVVRQICVNAIVALGATFVILGGEIDLSQGAVAALIGCECAYFIMNLGFPIGIAIVVALMTGLLIGVFTGVVITFLRVPSFIATLGVQYVLQGAVLLLTNSQPISGLPEQFTMLGRGYVGIIPVPTIILVIMFILGFFVLKYTAFGRNCLATGENMQAAALSGISVIKTKIIIFAIAGTMSALGGIVLSARLSSGQPSAASDLSLQALAAVFIGGTSRGSVMNTLAGALIIGLINNGLNLMEVNAYWQKIALGAIIIGAIALDAYRIAKESQN